MADARKRNFVTIVYPESAPENFKEIIESWHIPAFLSPLHDRDKNPDGEVKKAHYHLMLMFRGKKTVESVKELLKEINAVGCQEVNSLDGQARYFLHLDNPEKERYDRKDLIEFSGAEYDKLIERSSDELKLITELSQLIIEMGIDNVADALICCLDAGRDDLVRQLTQKSSYWFTALCKANGWRKQKMLLHLEKVSKGLSKKNPVKDGEAGGANP